MPNWVHCSIEITGDYTELKLLKRNIVGNKIIESLCPAPKELAKNDANSNSEEDIQAQEKSDIEKYGAKDWYKWTLQNWGIKWGDCRTKLRKASRTKLLYETDFAYSLPVPAMNKISAIYPFLEFYFSFFEKMGSFSGDITWKNGVIIAKHVGTVVSEEVEFKDLPLKIKLMLLSHRISSLLKFLFRNRNSRQELAITEDVPF